MAAGEGALPLSLCLWALLALPGATAVKVETEVELDFFQKTLPSNQESGEFWQGMEGEEFFHVDWAHKENIWRLPAFSSIYSFDTQGAVGNMAVMKNNLEIMMKRSNGTNVEDVAPTAKVFPQNPVELGDPNVLICFVDQFCPPMLNITWLRNGEELSAGVTETDFYPREDNTFRKFSYLTFVPDHGDFYVCKVDHPGLTKSLEKLWNSKEPITIPETSENVLCGLGLAIGILGITIGTVLFFKARRMDPGNPRRGPR